MYLAMAFTVCAGSGVVCVPQGTTKSSPILTAEFGSSLAANTQCTPLISLGLRCFRIKSPGDAKVLAVLAFFLVSACRGQRRPV